MKKSIVLTIVAAAVLLMSTFASAQKPSTTATLQVTGTVNSSIQLLLQSATGGVTLTGTSSAAIMALGPVAAYAASPTGTGAIIAAGGNSFTVTSPINVTVNVANVTSSNYTLTGQLGAADAFTWSVGGQPITTTASNITTNGTYGLFTPNVVLTVPFSVAAPVSISNTITFKATAN